MRQQKFFKDNPKAYGGDLRKTRRGRGARPLSTQDSMHLVLRSTRARGPLSMRRGQNIHRVRNILNKFADRYGIRIISSANAGNHLHIHMKLGIRRAYAPFIRAVTAAIAMAITGKSRWKKIDEKFWDQRPFTRIVTGRFGFERVEDYVEINRLEANGFTRSEARKIVANARAGRSRAGPA